MEQIEPVGAVANERRIILNPGIRPGSPEEKFELILGRLSHDEADAANESGGLIFRQSAAGKAPEPKADERDDAQWDKRIGNVGELRECFVLWKLGMGQQRDRPI